MTADVAQRPVGRARAQPLAVHAGLAIAFCAAACGGEDGGGAAPSADEDRAPVSVGAEDFVIAARERIATGPRIAGSLEPKRESVMRAEVGGQVLGVEVELGQTVAEGDLLARIERGQASDQAASARAALQAALHQLEVARRERERTARLVQAGALANRDLDTAESAVVAAQSRVTEARSMVSTASEQVGDATIRAPIAGVVAERDINEGDVVAPGAALFTIIDPSSMRLEASVPAQALPFLETGSPVTFSVRGYPDKVFTGQIQWISPAADRGTRQIPVLVEIPNDDGELIAHLFAEGRVASDARETLVVPRVAVDESSSTPTVSRVRDGRVERVTVTLGVSDDATERVEIAEGLSAGDVVLVRGARDLAAGTRVELPDAPSAARRDVDTDTPRPGAQPPAR